jgi:hypothetical protein
MWRSRLSGGLILAVVVGSQSFAIYAPSETRTVPVARLAANLEKELASAPRNADLHIKLARLYGMAYAMNAEEVPVTTRQTRPDEVWFGYEPDLVPHRPKPGADTTRAEASRQYLKKSLEHYRSALEINEGSLLARLGYGWTLDQSGDKSSAIVEYRRVIERAWPKEQSARGSMPGERFYTQETAGYLIPLLDPSRDAKEIEELRRRITHLRALPRAITPIAIPLVDDVTAKSLLDLDAQVPFDADGQGLQRRWTWITAEAGWLVYDPARQGKITSALQWFGNVTFWLFWTNGYEPLAALDDDGDGELNGRELRYLAVWHDVNRDGASDPGEVRPLEAHGIVAVSCHYSAGDGLLVAAQSTAGVRLRDGRTRATYDVILRPSASVSTPAPDLSSTDPSRSSRPASSR